MAAWSRDVRPMPLVRWGLTHNTISPHPVNEEDAGVRPEIRPGCIIDAGDDIGEE